MSMLDSFFAKGVFKGSQCKTLLKLTIPRIKLLRNRREIQLKQMRKAIAKLLESGQEATAHILVEHIFREENMMAAQEILELFCELMVIHLPIIETQRECPLDLKEAISSICFAAPRCADLPELLQVQMLFAAKYGKEFVAAATRLVPNCGANHQLTELLSVRAPSTEAKLKLLKEIAEEHDLDWDPSASEAEFLKPHEDLLNGPDRFIKASTFPMSSPPSLSSHSVEQSEPTLLPPSSSSIPAPPKQIEQADSKSEPAQFVSKIKNEACEGLPPSSSSIHQDPKQSEQATSKSEHAQFHSKTKDGTYEDLPPSSFSDPLPPKQSECAPSRSGQVSFPSQTKNESYEDLQYVLNAAQAAAETAEKAAMAARAAVELTQCRISDLLKKRNGDEIHRENSHQHNSSSNSDQNDVFKPNQASDSPKDLHEESKMEGKKSERSNEMLENHQPTHAPQLLDFFDDDSDLPHPNLFTSQSSNSASDGNP